MLRSKGIEKAIKAGLRSISASFPVAASLAQAWNEYESNIQFARIEEFFYSFGQHIGNIEERIKTVEDYILHSGEVPPLIERTIQSVKTEQSGKKRRLYMCLLSEAIAAGDSIPFDHKYTFIEVMDTLTEQDLNVLQRFQEGGTIRGKDLIDDDKSSYSENHASGIIMSLSKLEARGLISETDSEDYAGDKSIGGFGTEGHWLNRWRSKYLVLLPYGEIFLSMTMGKNI